MPESYEVGPIECGHCGNLSLLTVVAQDFSQVVTHHFMNNEPWGSTEEYVSRGWVHRMLICSACHRANFDRVFTHEGEIEVTEPLYPEPAMLPEGLPERIAKEYGAALKERRRNPNGYGALLGRVLDAICVDRSIGLGTKMGLTHRLEMLGEQEKLTSIKGAAGIRHLAAHADAGELLEEDVPFLESLVRYVLDHIYVIPAVNKKVSEIEAARRATTALQRTTHVE